MKKKDIKDTPINTRYPLDVLEAIRLLAQDNQRSFNGEVIWALREYISTKLDRVKQLEEVKK